MTAATLEWINTQFNHRLNRGCSVCMFTCLFKYKIVFTHLIWWFTHLLLGYWVKHIPIDSWPLYDPPHLVPAHSHCCLAPDPQCTALAARTLSKSSPSWNWLSVCGSVLFERFHVTQQLIETGHRHMVDFSLLTAKPRSAAPRCETL